MPGLRVFDSIFDGRFRFGADRVQFVFAGDSRSHHSRGEPLNRISVLPGIDLFRRSIASRFEAGVAPDAISQRFDQGGTVARARPLYGFACRIVNSQDIVAIDADARHAIGASARREVGHRRRLGYGH